MLIINKNNISLARGESVSLAFTILDTNGRPFILPPLPEGYESIITFTVRTSTYDEVVLQKVLHMNSDKTHIVVGDVVDDRSPNGYNRFISQSINTTEDLDEYFGDGNNKDTVVEYEGKYYFWARSDDGEGYAEYDFSFTLPLQSDETIGLDAKYYVYDLIYYIGKFKSSVTPLEFPFSDIIYKQEIIPPHKFIIGDSLNA